MNKFIGGSFMKTIINIYSKKAKTYLEEFKEKKYQVDVRLDNVHLKDINKLVGFNLFFKNDLFVGSETLFATMQPKGEDKSHNYHNLSPEDILEALKTISRPYCVLENKQNRIAIITSFISHLGTPINIVIELGSNLRGNANASINKLVTLFPRMRVNEYIDSIGTEKIYYLKIGNKAKEKPRVTRLRKCEPNGATVATLDSLPFEDVPFYGPCLLFAALFWSGQCN